MTDTPKPPKPAQVVAKLDKALNLMGRAQKNFEQWQSRMGTATGRAAVERGDRQWAEAERLFAEVRAHLVAQA